MNDSRRARTREVQLQLAELARLERESATLGRRMEMRLRNDAARWLTTGEPADAAEVLVRELSAPLREASVLAHLTGEYRARLRVSRLSGKRLVVQPQDDVELSILGSFRAAIARLRKAMELPIRRLEQLRDYYGEEVVAVLRGEGDEINRVLTDVTDRAITQGRTVTQARQDLSRQLRTIGLAETGTYRLETMFRTRGQMAYSAGRWEADHVPDVADLIWGYEYSAVGDNRTRPNHLAVDGVILPKEDDWWKRWWAPAGWNCRCTQLELLDEEAIVEPPGGVEPDPGFGVNFGILAMQAA